MEQGGPVSDMRMALIHDELLVPGGSERVFRTIIREFPEADLFTLAHNPDTTLPEFRSFEIRVSPLNRIIRSHAQFKALYPLASLVMSCWDFRGYDVVLTSSAHVAKDITRFDGLHICYCHYPSRAIWTPDVYFGSGGGLKERLFRGILPIMRRRDYRAAQRVDHFIANSNATRRAIRDFYGRDLRVIHAPVDFDRFVAGSGEPKSDHYLLVSRLETWKQVDYAVEAFSRLRRPLRIIGAGSDEARLRAMAGPFIEFAGRVDDETLVHEYGRARAVVFTPDIEWGLVPLEAISAGTPVIALDRSGVRETMRPITGDPSSDASATAVFFSDASPESLVDAVERFEQTAFDRASLTRHAEGFGEAQFRRKLRRAVEETTSSNDPTLAPTRGRTAA